MTCLSSMIVACLSEKFFRVFRPDTTILGYLIRGVKMNSLTVKRIIMTFAGIFLTGEQLLPAIGNAAVFCVL